MQFLQYPGISYPLDSPMALISFGLECIIVGVCFKWFLQSLLKWKRSTTRIREARDLGWSVFFLGLGLFYITIVFRDFRLSVEAYRHTLVLWGFVLLAVMNTLSMYIFERQWRTSRILPISFSCSFAVVAMIIGAVFRYDPLVVISVIVNITIMIIYFIYYANTLLKLVNFSRPIIRRLTYMFFTAFFAMGGFAFTMDILWGSLGLWSRIAGDLVVILGINMFIYEVDFIPDFREVDWMNKIKALLVINENGLPLYCRFFNKEKEVNLNFFEGLKKGFWSDEEEKADAEPIAACSDPSYDQMLISGAMNSVKNVLGELTGAEDVQTIKLPDKVLLVENIDDRMYLIIADAYMDSLKIRLKQFSSQFHGLFGETLQDWDGSSEIFAPADTMTAEIFSW